MSFTRADYPPLSTIGYVSTLTSTVFTPSSIQNLTQWLDASDSTTIYSTYPGTLATNGATVTYWRDKSSAGNSVSQYGTGPLYTSTSNALNFASGAGLSNSTGSALSSNVSFFCVLISPGSSWGSWGTVWGHFRNGYHDSDIQFRQESMSPGYVSWHTTNDNNNYAVFPTAGVKVMYSCTMSNGVSMFLQSSYSGSTASYTYTEGSMTIAGGTVAPFWIGRSDSGESYNGYICELVYYTTTLSTAQRQQVEGYLAWKWGLQASLSVGHPYASASPNAGYSSTLTSSLTYNYVGYTPTIGSYTAYVSTLTAITFNPTSIAGGVLWLDASLFTQANNTAVTTWPSASGSYTLSMTGSGTVNTSILNGLPVMTVATNQNWSLSSAYTTASYTFFFVSRQTGGTNARVFIGNGNRLYGYWGGYKNQLYTEGWLTPQSPGSDTAWDIYTIVRTSAGAGTFSRFGGSIATYSSSGAGMDGFYVNTGGCCGGETSAAQIAEVLIYNVDLSDANCRKIEGYLAWKWGLQANLTSGHPYASAGPNSTTSTLTSSLASMVTGYTPKTQLPLSITPYYTAFNPASFSTLALWIDGSDPLGTGVVPAQGTLISSLKDKSSKNVPISTFSTTVGFPTYKTAANGSLGALQLAAGNGLLISSISISPMMTLYAVYSPINPSTGVSIEQGVNALSNPGFLLTSVSTTSTMYVIGGGVTVTATGGTITTSGSSKIHTFTTTGANTFTITSPASVSVTYLVVAGGGGGGVGRGGGGGGGGVLAGTTTLTAGTYTITVGAGGANAYNDNQGGDGGSSSIGTTVVTTGGGGGGGWSTNAGRAGGSGGGASAGSTASGGTGVSGQGYAGSARLDGNTGGGGGGAGAAASGSGGAIGISSMITGVTTYYAGGGGAGASSGGATGVAYGGTYEVANGTYGGGNGANTQGTHHNYQDAVANTGGGGGGQEGYGGNSGYGGSGIVILSYQSISTPVATGGTITTSGLYKIHTFTTTGATTFTLTSPGSITAQVLVVGGGGAGGSAYVGGGGGAGGAVYNATFTITSGSYTVTVGAGGARTTVGVGYVGASGTNSSFSSITGTGGGGGGSYMGVAATNGGCGGGGPYNSGQFGTGSQGGNGAPYGTDSGGSNCGGGGGGMGGTAPTPSGVRPSGGAGATYTVAGASYLVSGGGGAGSDGLGGLGRDGGGLGGNGGGGGNTPSNGGDATGYGSGGGGGGGNNGSLYGGAGYQGIVIIAYLA